MPRAIRMPDLGCARVVLSLWYAQPGDPVYAGDRLVEVLLEGATFDVPAPATGILKDKLAFPDDPLVTGQILGHIDEQEV